MQNVSFVPSQEKRDRLDYYYCNNHDIIFNGNVDTNGLEWANYRSRYR